MSACSKDVNISGNDAVDQPVGEVSISLSSVDGHQIVTPLKSVVDVPDPNAFEVEIYNSKGIRLYRDTYGNSIGRKIPLNAGDYRLLAQYGDSLGVGFDVVYFAADHNFTVHGQTSENVEAVARMANVKVAVNFGDNLKQFYPEHYARVKHPSLSEYLQFNADETRAGYIPAENLTLEIYAEVDGTWKYYKAPAVECAPNDFITFNVDVDPRVGQITVGIEIDNTVETIDKGIVIPEEAAPSDAPVITFSGFDADNSFVFNENADCSGIQADFVVMGGIAGCTLDIDSDYLSALGIPASVDLVNAGQSVVQALNSVGITWPEDIAGKRIACVDFSGMSKEITFDADNMFKAIFSLTVTDNAGKQSTSEDYNMAISPEMTLSVIPGNAFANRISGVSAVVKKAYGEKLSLEYSQDGTLWTAAPAGSSSGETASFGDITSLSPNTSYLLRLKYDGNSQLVTEPVTIVTEEALQIENGSMENWGYMDTNLHYPEPGYNTYWATRNTQTTSSGISAWYTKNSGTYSSTDAVSGNAALLTTIGWGSGNTWAGYMWSAIINNISPAFLALGSADASGNITTKGIPFGSRPDAVTFFCKYAPKNGSVWEARVEVLCGDEVIGTASMSSGSEISSYAKQTLDISYSDKSRKATGLYLYFTNDNRDRSYSRDDISKESSPDRYQGSVLLLDDIVLVYGK